jgi:hypothetical protein
MVGGNRPRPAEALSCAATADEQLKWEGVYDRRWRRHRDQLLTVTGVVFVAVGLMVAHWVLVPVGAAGLIGMGVREQWQVRRGG